MNSIERALNKIAHKLDIYPHDGKNVIYIKGGELHQGSVIGPSAFTGHVPLSEIGSVRLMEIRNEIAEATDQRKAVVSRKLHHGEIILYPPEKKEK